MVAAHFATLNDLACVLYHGYGALGKAHQKGSNGHWLGMARCSGKIVGRGAHLHRISRQHSRLAGYSTLQSSAPGLFISRVRSWICSLVHLSQASANNTTHGSHPTQGRLWTAPWTTDPYKGNAQMHSYSDCGVYSHLLSVFRLKVFRQFKQLLNNCLLSML